MASEWQPSPEDTHMVNLQKGLDGLTTASKSSVVQVPASSGTTAVDKFVLDSKAYHDLHAYVLTGKGFPKDTNIFDNSLPRSGFSRIEAFDSDIYNKTQTTIMGIGQTCYWFTNSDLYKIIAVAGDSAAYASSAIRYLETQNELDLRQYFAILMHPRYANPSNRDDEFFMARQASESILITLHKQAESIKERVDTVVRALVSFRDATRQYHENILYLFQQYRDGPVKRNSRNMTKPFLFYLQEDLQSNIVKLQGELTLSDDKHKDSISYTSAACTTWTTGIFGIVATSVEADKAASLKNEIKNLDEKIENLKSSNPAEANLLQNINVLLFQCTDIFKKMDAAISAASNLATCFAQHADGYQLIRSSLKGLSDGLTLDNAVLRQRFVEKKRAQFTNDLRKVCSWAFMLYTSLNFRLANWRVLWLQTLAESFQKTLISA
ncbi:hypothetical protein TWF281_006681 [Arthrobotrys megalospora]